jgi:hypothetical protein
MTAGWLSDEKLTGVRSPSRSGSISSMLARKAKHPISSL